MESSNVPKDCQQHDKWIKMEDVHTVVASRPSYQSILFSDTKTNLMDYISSMKTLRTLGKFLQTIPDIDTALPDDSPLWPGSTPLHLAVMFSESKGEATNLIRQLLKQGASVQVQNSRGATPLHLAFRLAKYQTVALLLLRLLENDSVANMLDDDNLSHLHIACAVSDHRNVWAKKLLDQPGIESTVNAAYVGKALDKVETGWTPLHVAVHLRHVSLVQSLLKLGASTTCKDAQGYSALHRLFGAAEEAKPLADVLFRSEQLKDCEVEGVGLTHLHVALWFDDDEAVQRLLDSGSNIEATINSRCVGADLEKWAGCTPLHVAVIMNRARTVEILLRRGADIFVKNHNGRSPLSSALTISQRKIGKVFVKHIRSNEGLKKRLKEELGLTMLHLACYRREPDQVKAELMKGADVNARIHEDANFWAGYTPLHLVILFFDGYSLNEPKEKALVDIVVLDYGCDVNQQDVTGKTAFHLAFAFKNSGYNRDITPILLSVGADITIADEKGDSVISYALKLFSRYDKHSYEIGRVHIIVYRLLCQLHRMKLVEIKTNEVDENLAMNTLEKYNIRIAYPSQEEFWNHVQATERVKIGQRGLSLRSFLHETHAISIYPSLTPGDRFEWTVFFALLDMHSFPLVTSLLRIQYRKAVARLSLIDPAGDALKTLISSNFPDLLVDMILKYLPNSELKQLIAAAVDTDL